MSDSNEVSTALYAVNHRVHRLVNSHLKGEKNLNQLRRQRDSKPSIRPKARHLAGQVVA